MERFILTDNNREEAAAKAAHVLQNGGLILYPTETVYGVGVDATTTQAVDKLIRYKNRPAGKAISVAVKDRAMAEQYVQLTDSAVKAYATFLPGPVTVISKNLGQVDPRLPSEVGRLGIRISSHPFVQQLLSMYPHPVTATSANASGKATPYNPDQALEQLTEAQRSLVDLIIDAGTLPRRQPSTVIDTTEDVQEVYRAGELTSTLLPVQISHSENETIAIAVRLLNMYEHFIQDRAIVFALEGEMGAGKTRIAKGIAQAAGVTEMVTSPSYTLMNEYETVAGKVYHLDLWRAASVTPEELQINELLHPHSIIIIEWAAPFLEYLREKRDEIAGVRVVLEVGKLEERLISVAEL